jgi:ABC-type Fe3+ transport system substrate-binding protein
LPSIRFLIGLGTVIVVLVAGVVLYTTLGKKKDDNTPAAAPDTTLTCLGGSEKSELMADPDVKRILHDKYHLTINFQSLGSYDQVQLKTEELNTRKVDCLWPSSASAQGVFEAQHQGAFKEYKAENVLQSPEVIYAGPKGTDALVGKNVVQQRGDQYYIVNMKALLLDYITKKQTWEGIGANGLNGPITVSSTDPARSNSGFVLAQLELNILATEDVFSAPNIDQARKALPKMRELYDAQGLQARSSDAGFREWLTQGAELKSPLYAGYENQLIQQVAQAGANSASILKNVRVLYPEPTIYSDHPLLALNANAGRFIEAMKDSEIQTIAWKKFGFRSAVQVGLNNVADFKDIKLSDQVRTTAPPAADVTLALLDCMKDAKKCQ